MQSGASTEQQPHRQIGRPRAQRVLDQKLRSRVDHRRLPARLILAPNESMSLISLQTRDLQILGVVIVNTRSVFTRDAHQPGDGGAVRMGEFASLFEAVAACDVLHDVRSALMGQLDVPQRRAFQLAEFPAAGGTAQQPAAPRSGAIPLPETDIPKTQLAVGWAGEVEASKTVEWG